MFLFHLDSFVYDTVQTTLDDEELITDNDFEYIDEETGTLELGDIVRKCAKVFESYEVNFCHLFGSYAKGKATPVSDVDLLISANVKGLKFYGLVEEIRMTLHKKVDILDMNQLKGNIELTEEIFKDGIKIYG